MTGAYFWESKWLWIKLRLEVIKLFLKVRSLMVRIWYLESSYVDIWNIIAKVIKLFSTKWVRKLKVEIGLTSWIDNVKIADYG